MIVSNVVVDQVLSSSVVHHPYMVESLAKHLYASYSEFHNQIVSLDTCNNSGIGSVNVGITHMRTSQVHLQVVVTGS